MIEQIGLLRTAVLIQVSIICNRWDKIAALKLKDLIDLPWRVAFVLQEDGWYLRKDIVWNNPNAMPESVRDRPTSHMNIFYFSQNRKSNTTIMNRLKKKLLINRFRITKRIKRRIWNRTN
uniref:DNA methyltransferase n=1 Tax=Bacillus sp. FSL R5-0286 TaxID=2954620 RepID=UPI00406CB9FE